ncbi:unnamed protein product [Alternaria burnsii]|nr:unnamed protein product [Alternaria burnsii]
MVAITFAAAASTGGAAFLPSLGAGLVACGTEATTAAVAVTAATTKAAVGVGAAVGQTAVTGAVSGAVNAAVSGAVGTALGTAATAGTAQVLAGAAGTAASNAAVAAGAVAPGALSGAASALAVVGPAGWVMLGADGYSWDCWKPIVLDESLEPSQGISLRELCCHPNLRRITAFGDGFLAENIRGEKFRLSPTDVNGALAFHGTAM